MAEYPEIFCVKCRKPNKINKVDLGSSTVPVYLCLDCGVTVDFPLQNAGKAGKAKDAVRELVPPSPEVLSASAIQYPDSCDLCGAISYIRVVMPSGNDLWFCGHHFDKFRISLVAQGGMYTDYRPAELKGTA